MRHAFKLVALAVVVLLLGSSALAEVQCDYGMQTALGCMIPCCHADTTPAVSHTQADMLAFAGACASMGCGESACLAPAPQVQGTIKQSSLGQAGQTLPAVLSALIPLAALRVEPRDFDQGTSVRAPGLLLLLQVFRI